MSPSVSFPAQLRKYRKSNGWTQKQLAKKWYVSPETISAWELGRRRPDISLVPMLANELAMDKSELIEYISPSSDRSKENRNQETDPDELEHTVLFVPFQNQKSCEEHIRKESRKAKTIKILTIRGNNYFVGNKSLLQDVIKEGTATIEALVLSPESGHITEELAGKLQKTSQKNSAEDVRMRMRMSLKYLTDLTRLHKNFNVKCYNEEPIFKILIFDDVMFVSSFAREVPSNDENAEMFIIQRGNALFAGFEKVFKELSRRSAIPV